MELTFLKTVVESTMKKRGIHFVTIFELKLLSLEREKNHIDQVRGIQVKIQMRSGLLPSKFSQSNLIVDRDNV
jgi:hypothetical protein